MQIDSRTGVQSSAVTWR